MSGLDLEKIKTHINDRPYMSGVDRDNLRVKATGEVFTPTELVNQILDQHPNELFTDPTKTVIDIAVGDGQFLGQVLIRKVSNGIEFETALKSLYGIDLMQDNVLLTRDRLLCGQEHLRWIVEKNIIQADTTKVKNWNFDGCDPYKSAQDRHFDKFFT
jgi:hypothetical protein